MLCQLTADIAEDLGLQLLHLLLSRKDFRFVVLKLRGDIALGVDQGLLANVIFRHGFGVGLGHLDVIAKDLVEPNFQALDPGSFTLHLFEVVDPLTGLAGGFQDIGQGLAVAGSNDSEVASGGWRVIGQG